MPDKMNSRRRAEHSTQDKVTAVALSGLMLWQSFGACTPVYAATEETAEVQTDVAPVTDEAAPASLDYPVSPAASFGYWDATITHDIKNANVAYFAYHTAKDTVGVKASDLKSVSSKGTIRLIDFNSSTLVGKTHGYVLFFVKQSDGYLLTGLGASGNGEFYSLQDPRETFEAIKDYPGLSNVVAAAKSAGYIGVFGYSRKPGDFSLKASFEVYGQSPELTASAKVDKTTGVKPGDEITLTVTLNPQKPETQKKVVLDDIKVSSAKVNGNDVTIDNLQKQADGTYVGTVTYKVTDADCDAGKVAFTAKASCTYSVATGMVAGSEVITKETITKDVSCESAIASRDHVKYTFVSATQGMELPEDVTNCLPTDDAFHYDGDEVRPADPKQTRVKVADGTWTFAGWDKQSDTMSANGVEFTGTWEYAADSVADHVKLTTTDVSVPYDGKAHSAGVATAIDDANGYGVQVEYQVPGTDTWTKDPSQIVATDVEGTPITVNVRASVKDYYDGYVTGTETLTISKRKVTLKSEDGNWPYDGQPHSKDQVTIGGDGFVDGEVANVRATGSVTEVVDGVTNTIEFDTLDAYKPGNYDVTKDEGTLSVMANQDEVTVGIAGNSTSVVYDGTEKSVSGYDVTSISGNLFAEKDIVFSGTAEAKGTDAGTYEMGLAAGQFANGNTNFGNVKFDITDGKLTVRPQSISAADDDYKGVTVDEPQVAPYDGNEHKWVPTLAAADGTKLVEGTDYEVSYGTDDFTNVGGAIEVTVTGKGNYTGSVTREYKVTPRELTVTTESASKPYDGTSLTAPGRVEGLVDGETVELRLTGSQTEVGSSDNTYELAWTGSARQANYTVADGELGKLTVTAAPEVDPDEPTVKPADNAASNKGVVPETGDPAVAADALAAMGGTGLLGVIAAAIRRRRNRE